MATASHTLNHFSVKVLANLLSVAGWYQTATQFYVAGKILDDVLPEVPKEPGFANVQIPTEVELAAQKAWSRTQVTVELTPKQVVVITAAVKHFVDKSQLNPSVAILPLLDLAGLSPEE